MRNIFVPQIGQTPWVAGLPFFMVMALVSFISLLVRHFMQYASIGAPPLIEIIVLRVSHLMADVKRKCYEINHFLD
jgi:hypothetical protein